MNDPDALKAAVLQAVNDDDDDTQAELILHGLIVLDVLRAGQVEPLLITHSIGEPAVWQVLGMLRGAQLIGERLFDSTYEEGDDQ